MKTFKDLEIGDKLYVVGYDDDYSGYVDVFTIDSKRFEDDNVIFTCEETEDREFEFFFDYSEETQGGCTCFDYDIIYANKETAINEVKRRMNGFLDFLQLFDKVEELTQTLGEIDNEMQKGSTPMTQKEVADLYEMASEISGLID